MPPKRKRRAAEPSNDESDGGGSSSSASAGDTRATKFAMLQPRVRKIPEHTIKSKWTTLPESAQERVKELFRSVELPVITKHRDERKRIEAQTALAVVKKK
jgi:kinetochore protein Fta7